MLIEDVWWCGEGRIPLSAWQRAVCLAAATVSALAQLGAPPSSRQGSTFAGHSQATRDVRSISLFRTSASDDPASFHECLPLLWPPKEGRVAPSFAAGQRLVMVFVRRARTHEQQGMYQLECDLL